MPCQRIGINLSNRNLSNANLEKANLSQANLANSNLTNVNLEQTNLSGASLVKSILLIQISFRLSYSFRLLPTNSNIFVAAVKSFGSPGIMGKKVFFVTLL